MRALIIIFLLLPSYLFAQDITGIWTGSLTTSQKKLPYEVVISDSSGILIGYSHITFTVNGKDIIAVKKIDVTSNNDIITLEDEDIIANNFPDAGPKHIHQIATLELSTRNSFMYLTGTFKTKNVTNLKPITGDIELQKKNIADSSKLMAKLNDMNLRSSLSFVQIKKITDKVAIEPIAVFHATKFDNDLAFQKIIPVAPVIIEKKKIAVPVKDTTAIAIKKPVEKKTPVIVQPKPTVTKVVAAVPPKVIKAPPVTVIQPVAKPTPVVAVAPPVQKPVVVSSIPKVQPKPDIIPAGAGADIAHRQIENIETFEIESDSIRVTLYDNGIVDGDTVTVFLNGKIIMGKIGLSTDPVTKTVYVTPDLGDSLQFIMYAENLGSIPPNTGLMILQDGKKRHEIFFSGDLQKNAAITLLRKHT
jgi:hypothetical protein